MRLLSQRLLVVVALIIGLFAGAAWTYAQSVVVQPVTPTVVSGPDVGFRIEGNRGGTPVGTLVVKVNGQWVAVVLGSSMPKRITAK